MKHKKRIGELLLAVLASSFVLSISQVQGATLDSLNKQEQQHQTQISELEVTINKKLTSINLKQMEIEDLQTQIAAAEASQSQTMEAISEQKEVVASRKEQLESRLVALQTSNSTTNRIMLLVESESFTDFINRAYIVGQLQSADNEHFETAIAEQQKLEELEKKLADEIQTVKTAEARINKESVALAADMSSLRETLSENKTTLSQLLTDVNNEETRLAVEAAQAAETEAAQKAEATKAEAESVATATASSEQAVVESAQTVQTTQAAPTVVQAAETASSQETVAAASSASSQESISQITDSSTASAAVSQPVVSEPVAAQTQGKTLVVSATAYSRHEAGMSDYTATGINLAVNPMVIAVDPSVIPLGSLVSVPGYGVAIAGDTGGAIIGNKIDLHMEDLAACNAYGRQTLTITILQ